MNWKKLFFNNLLASSLRTSIIFQREIGYASLPEAIQKRNALYNMEVKRQKESVGRIEKITVQYMGIPKNETFIMNKNISTPYHVAQHVNEVVSSKSALAVVDGNQLWDLHRPLERDCSLRLLRLNEAEPHHANRAYWRACSFMLGALVEKCFKPNIRYHLHSFPSPNVKSGSFTYDVQLSLDDWSPSKDEMRILSAEFVKLCRSHLPFHRLEVDSQVAEEIFSYNPFKSSQIPDIAMNNPGNKITLYRVGDHLDISRGPMIANTRLIGRTSITAVHKLDCQIENMYRFQGVSIPSDLRINHFAYSILEERAMKLNPTRVPGMSESSSLQSAEAI